MRLIRHLHRGFCTATIEEVRVRFAPSPTGSLHLGGLRTALYNYLFAKKHNGTFILRIEDTDQHRLVPEAYDTIESSLREFGLNYDEGPSTTSSPFGPYIQSKRLPLYKEAAERLIDSHMAYRCFCTEERVAFLRKESARRGEIPKYDRRCMSLSAEEAEARVKNGEKFVVRLKIDRQDVHFNDLVYGSITQNIDESDAVMLKSDGFPTYHLAHVVDDRHMHISHVIRGVEWLSSAGKHNIIYKAFNWKPPQFIHLPVLLKSAGKKLSKRDKDAFLDYYTDTLGVLPIALLNLLIRNGSGIKDHDINKLYSLEEMVNAFDPSLINRNNLLVDQVWLQRLSRLALFEYADFDKEVLPFIQFHVKRIIPNVSKQALSREHIEKVFKFLREKEEAFAFGSHISEANFRWLFMIGEGNLERVLEEFGKDENAKQSCRKLAESDVAWSDLKGLASGIGWTAPRLFAFVRMALIDTKMGPPISEIVDFFGLEHCIQRMKIVEKSFK
ncbi:hypothetical protein WR25_00363 [Diploscapter pachys]|uniref:Nondiscriminating glutamyl-tRNA synthetase EARS2, mitochondrial n=1 Tax=Diploscapter pachys TaxID=2018661 RepID=A0A2A2JYX7_9BILA|nr:hypothetical protein WR25_00363 [Diploscapter pachys]